MFSWSYILAMMSATLSVANDRTRTTTVFPVSDLMNNCPPWSIFDNVDLLSADSALTAAHFRNANSAQHSPFVIATHTPFTNAAHPQCASTASSSCFALFAGGAHMLCARFRARVTIEWLLIKMAAFA
jgi:hypothetical protein